MSRISGINSITSYENLNVGNRVNPVSESSASPLGNSTVDKAALDVEPRRAVPDIDISGGLQAPVNAAENTSPNTDNIQSLEILPKEVQNSDRELPQYDAFDYAQKYDPNATYSMTGADSRLEDLDAVPMVSDAERARILESYNNMMHSGNQEDAEASMKKILDTSWVVF